jgi:hypothetical protein
MSGNKTQDELRAELGELRAEIGDTVGALAERVDVPARVKARKDETAARVQEQAAQARLLVRQQSTKAQDLVAAKAPALDKAVREQPALAAAVTALIAFLVVGSRIRSRRRRRSAAG